MIFGIIIKRRFRIELEQKTLLDSMLDEILRRQMPDFRFFWRHDDFWHRNKEEISDRIVTKIRIYQFQKIF